MLKDCPFKGGHYYLLTFQNKEVTELNDICLTSLYICTYLCYPSLQIYKYTLWGRESFLFWPNFICGGVIFTDKSHRRNFVVKSSVATVLFCFGFLFDFFFSWQTVVKLIMSSNWFSCTELVVVNITTTSKDFSENLGQNWWLSNKDLIECLQTHPATTRILPHKL